MPWKQRPTQKSHACNGGQIVRHRAVRGWTQAELAERAGYSERLIVKAESGKPIATETIEVLADTLSNDSHQVAPDDLVFNPVQIAKDYIVAVYEQKTGWVDALEHVLDPGFIFRFSGEPEHLPFAGEHRGLEAVRKAFEIFFSILEVPPGHDPRPHYKFVGEGDEVTMTGESWIHPKGTPLETPIKVWHRFVFSDAKLVLIEDLFDTLAGKKVIAEAQ